MKSSLSSEHLVIFTRYPEPGTTKTRLAKLLGPVKAAEIQKKLTEHTLQQAERLLQLSSVSISIYFDGGSPKKMQEWLGTVGTYRCQGEGDLGSRMARAVGETFKQGFSKIVIIGTDCPCLQADHIKEAFETLDRKDLVLGPAADGGYYLIGLRQHEEALFKNIDWGTASVLAKTLNLAAAKDLSCTLLEKLHDVDRPEDLNHIRHHPHL